MTGKWLIELVRAGEQPPLYFADAAQVVGAAQTQTCRYKLVVSVNTSSDLRVWGREQMTSYIHQHGETFLYFIFQESFLMAVNKCKLESINLKLNTQPLTPLIAEN